MVRALKGGGCNRMQNYVLLCPFAFSFAIARTRTTVHQYTGHGSRYVVFLILSVSLLKKTDSLFLSSHQSSQKYRLKPRKKSKGPYAKFRVKSK